MPQKEAVVFLFYKEGKILVEERPVKFLNNAMAVSIPSGRIEKRDGSGKEALVNALKREVVEELAGKIKIEEYFHLASHNSDEVNMNFHCFAITKWSGEMPDHTIEDGKKFSRLFWIELSEYRKYLKFKSSIYFCEELIEKIKRN